MYYHNRQGLCVYVANLHKKDGLQAFFHIKILVTTFFILSLSTTPPMGAWTPLAMPCLLKTAHQIGHPKNFVLRQKSNKKALLLQEKTYKFAKNDRQERMKKLSKYVSFIADGGYTVLFNLRNSSFIVLGNEEGEYIFSIKDCIEALQGKHPDLFAKMLSRKVLRCKMTPLGCKKEPFWMLKGALLDVKMNPF